MRPHCESLLPSNLSDGVVITSPYASISEDALIHSENCPGMLCSTLKVLSPQDRRAFQLVHVCTVYRVVKSTSLQKHVILGQDFSPHIMHVTIIGIPGWVPAEINMWPQLWTVFHLGCDLSHQVWL